MALLCGSHSVPCCLPQLCLVSFATLQGLQVNQDLFQGNLVSPLEDLVTELSGYQPLEQLSLPGLLLPWVMVMCSLISSCLLLTAVEVSASVL